jgi:ribosomal protein S18 acetylase RimI-like enzyme
MMATGQARNGRVATRVFNIDLLTIVNYAALWWTWGQLSHIAPMIRDVRQSDLESVRAFLEAHLDSSLFLLSNLAVHGPAAGEHPYSGTFRLVEEGGRPVAVFCLTRQGTLLVQAGARTGLAEAILEACESDPIEITGVIGEWSTAEALWRLLCDDPRFIPSTNTRDVLYGRPLTDADVAGGHRISPQEAAVRLLAPEDFAQWEPLNCAYLMELSLPSQVSLEQRKEEFESLVREHRWWGAFDGRSLISIGCLNAVYGRLGQVGGIYTSPALRRMGWSRAVVHAIISDSRSRHRFDRLVLFTGEDNRGARRLYESLGFQFVDRFALLFGARRRALQGRHKWAGHSGEVYTYDIHEWPARLSPGPGNFIFASNAAGAWRAVAIGESADLAELRWHPSRHQGVTHIHVRLNFNPVAVRRREVSDLASRWSPPGQDAVA